jgi:hypothetical protein
VSLIGVVFNPGRGADAQYFFDVMNEIGKPNPKAWHSRLTTHHVGGESSWPYDDDPVSVLSMGLGKVFLYEGPGVPTYLDAHSSTNFVSKDVKVFSGSSVLPTPSRTGPPTPPAPADTSILVTTQVEAVINDEGKFAVPPTFSAADDLKSRGIQGTVVPNSTDIDFTKSTPVVTYKYAPSNMAPITIITQVEAQPVDWGDGEAHYVVPPTFSAAADLQSRGIKGTIYPNSVGVDLSGDDAVVTYKYLPPYIP